MGKSNIEWTEVTWNPTTGCTKVSPGCAHCYAESLTKRYAGAPGWPAEFKPWTPANAAENVVLHPDRLDAPLRWKTPRMVFVDSMSDLFHENIGESFIDRVFRVMWETPQHTYQILTKRPARMREYLTIRPSVAAPENRLLNDDEFREAVWGRVPLPNVWLGVTVENQHWADVRIPILLSTPAAVRFVSAEPLLGPVDMAMLKLGKREGQLGTFNQYLDALHGTHCDGMGFERKLAAKYHLDWVIVGGESGPKHRRFDPEWARSIVRQCRGAQVDCFVKQMGGARPGTKLEDLPADLRVREFPR